MREDDFDTFSDCWEQACEGIGRAPTAKQIEWAFECLKDKSIEQIKQALVMHAREPKEGQFQPTASNIIKHIEGTKEDRKAQAEAAWRRVLDNMNRNHSAVFDDPAIHYGIMVGFGDWQTVAEFDSAKFECQQMYRSFINAYSNYSAQPYMPRMVGVFELASATGESRFETHYIGDKTKALTVEEKGRNGSIQAVTNGVTHALESLKAMA